MTFKDLANTIARGIDDHSDVLLTLTALVGLVCTVGLVIKETPDAMDILDDSRELLDRIDRAVEDGGLRPEDAEVDVKRIKKDTAIKLVKNYIPAEIAFGITAGSIFGSNKVSRERNAALSAALNAANIMYSEYREKTRETVGEKKENQIYDDVRKDHIDKTPLPPPDSIYRTGNGDTLCHIETLPGDVTTGIYFYSSPEAVHAAINNANAEGIESGYVSMEDLLFFLGLRIKSYGTGLFGWQIRSRNDLIQTREGSHVHESGKPVLDIGFYNPPYQGFDRFG